MSDKVVVYNTVEDITNAINNRNLNAAALNTWAQNMQNKNENMEKLRQLLEKSLTAGADTINKTVIGPVQPVKLNGEEVMRQQPTGYHWDEKAGKFVDSGIPMANRHFNKGIDDIFQKRASEYNAKNISDLQNKINPTLNYQRGRDTKNMVTRLLLGAGLLMQ